MTYKPIEDYGIIGNMHTAALVGVDGSIDWYCHPQFDSPSVFGAILDHDKGGHFRIGPVRSDATQRQFYWPDTNVLVTRFLTVDGVGQVVDYMPVGVGADESGHHWLIRKVQVVRGTMRFRAECRPAFDYARQEHETVLSQEGACFHGSDLSLSLVSPLPLQVAGNAVVAEFTVEEGQTAIFALREIGGRAARGGILSEAEEFDLFERTVQYWRHWLSNCTYQGRWREAVQRSALALKLLTFEPTGAIVAAPTCSLPEQVGGERNWDYRYAWIRDAAFTLYGFFRIGFTEEAADFMRFLRRITQDRDPNHLLSVMYSVDGHSKLHEETLSHLEGYRRSQPVRIGNGAHDQLQLDIYGELMDSVYLDNKYRTPIAYDLWIKLRGMVDWVCDNWKRKDEGIWEVRGGRQHFVYSKLMCWVAVDRGLRLAMKRSFPCNRDKWYATRDEIFEEIISRGWSKNREAFVQYFGSNALDASNLMMPLVFYLSPSDPRVLKTIDAICDPPSHGGLLSNSLVYRYNASAGVDGLSGDEGTFNMCTFWLVEAITRAGGVEPKRLDQARLMFEEMLGYANHVGLYAEETGSSGEALGNFPQAFTHLSLISAAFNLDRALGGGD